MPINTPPIPGKLDLRTAYTLRDCELLLRADPAGCTRLLEAMLETQKRMEKRKLIKWKVHPL